MKLIKLTNTVGRPVWLVAAWIIKLSVPLPDEYPHDANTVVTHSGGTQAVKETPEYVVKMLEGMSQ